MGIDVEFYDTQLNEKSKSYNNVYSMIPAG
jgi:hypothetical protein